MKKLIIAALVILLTSCQSVKFTISTNNGMNTDVKLTQNNFNNLGHFTGIASTAKSLFSIKNSEGLAALAKQNLIENAKKAGVEIKGSRVLANVIIDMVQTEERVTVNISGDVIEFVK